MGQRKVLWEVSQVCALIGCTSFLATSVTSSTEEAVGIIQNVKKVIEGVVLITDVLQAMYLGDGTYQFGGHQVIVEDGKAQLSDGTLASSTVTMVEALLNTMKSTIS